MLEATLKWRQSSGVDSLSYDQVRQEGATGKMQRLRMQDKEGRPVLLMRPRFENTRQAEGQIQFLTWNVEAMIRTMAGDEFPRGAGVDLASEQMTLLVDFTDYSILNAPPTKTSMETMHILQNQ
jgi:polyribonucleotide 5'-hydroxyl-kinase